MATWISQTPSRFSQTFSADGNWRVRWSFPENVKVVLLRKFELQQFSPRGAKWSVLMSCTIEQCIVACVCVRERRKIELTAWGKQVSIPLNGIRTCTSGIRDHRASDYTTRAGTPRAVCVCVCVCVCVHFKVDLCALLTPLFLSYFTDRSLVNSTAWSWSWPVPKKVTTLSTSFTYWQRRWWHAPRRTNLSWVCLYRRAADRCLSLSSSTTTNQRRHQPVDAVAEASTSGSKSFFFLAHICTEQVCPCCWYLSVTHTTHSMQSITRFSTEHTVHICIAYWQKAL